MIIQSSNSLGEDCPFLTLPEYRPIYTEDVLKIEKFLKEKYPELSS